MYSSRFVALSAFAGLLSFAAADSDSVCYSYGIDFADEQHYFINSLSKDPFTCVSQFEGCNEDYADILLIDPNEDEYLCTEIPTTPSDTSQLSTCPIRKDQMMSGHWTIQVLGNNGDDGIPFAWQRGSVSHPLDFVTTNPH